MKWNKTILGFGLLQSALLITCSSIGFFTVGFYHRESANWAVQSRAQDLIDLLFILPVLTWSTLRAAAGNRFALQAWAGTMAYLAYTFLIYCFDVHFNRLFIAYLLVLAIAFYSLLYFLSFFRSGKFSQETTYPEGIRKFAGWYLVVIAAVFMILWYAAILPAILADTQPVGLAETGLFTNPVHILDLSFLLPGVAFSGVLLLRRNKTIDLFVPVLLVFLALMNITIAVLTVYMMQYDLPGSLGIVAIMGALLVVNLYLLLCARK